ncbi:MAG: RNA pseudouridine synthase [Candidatus Cloacimonadota bacterium]|nr:MAG: RNA pseudouridine synthase [Candidatus Cloacimonadota bacterium]
MITEELIVKNAETKTKFIDYAVQNINQITSRKGIKKAIERGFLLLNGKKARTDAWLKKGNKITLLQSNIYKGKIFKLKINVIYEDDYLAVINKPAGYPVSGNKFKTITNALPFNLKNSSEKDRLSRIHPVHRLDSLTAGLLICAKTARAAVYLSKMFENGEIRKTYRALLIGKTPERGVIDFPINNCRAVSEYKKIKSIETLKFGAITLAELFPKTGRTHQLRIHTAFSGFPVLGDPLYPEDENFCRYKGKGLFLAATGLRFKHPFSDELMSFEISAPSKFEKYLERESKRFDKYQKNKILTE